MVVIDARMLGPRGHGIALYVEELAEALRADPELAALPLHFLVAPDCPKNSPVRNFSHSEVAIPFLAKSEIYKIPRILKKLGAKLYVSPSFSALAYYPCPHAMVLHDLNHLHFGSLAQKLYYRLLVKCAARSALVLLTVSETSRQEIAQWLDCTPDRIRVAPNAITLAQKQEFSPERLGLAKGKFFLAMGNSKPHKNLDLLLAAYTEYRRESTHPWPLVLAGYDSSTPPAGVQAANGLNYGELMGLLAASGGLLMPSLYEGFSRPPVEAALLGVPCVVSDIPVHREVLCDVTEAKFLPAQDRAAWKTAFQQLAAATVKPAAEQSREKIRKRYGAKSLLEPFREAFQRAGVLRNKE